MTLLGVTSSWITDYDCQLDLEISQKSIISYQDFVGKLTKPHPDYLTQSGVTSIKGR